MLGSLALVADPEHALKLTLQRDQASLRLGDGAVMHAEKLGVHLAIRGMDVSFLPFTVELDSEPAAGELENHLVTHALRGLFARFMGLFWPTHRSPRDGHDVLLALGANQPWGPISLCVGHGGALELEWDHDGVGLRSEAGLFLASEALAWLPEFTVHLLRYRFRDGAVTLQISGVRETMYREAAPVSPFTEHLVAHLLRMLVNPHLPAWTQRVGMRILPPPAMPAKDPSRIAVWRAQLPGGYAKLIVAMDPQDRLTISASGVEIVVRSERGLHVDVPGLHLRVGLQHARYHMQTGEVQIGELGQLENALAEAVLRHELNAIDPTAAAADTVNLVDILDRFPTDDDGRRQLFADKLVRVLLAPDTAIVVQLHPDGLLITVDPPLKLDGIAGLDFLLGGLRFDFLDAAFHLDLERDSLLAAALTGTVIKEGESVLNSLLVPLLPQVMRTPGYGLAFDPDPSVTLAALVRTLSLGKFGRFTAG